MASIAQATRSVEEQLRALRDALNVYTSEQGVRRLVDASRLTLATAVTDFARTRHDGVERRVRALHDTRACIDELDVALDDVVFGVGSLVRKLARAATALERLHTACAAADDEDDETTRHSNSNDSGNGAMTDTTSEPCAEVQRCDAAMRLRDVATQLQQMRAAHVELHSTSATCKQLDRDSTAQLAETASVTSTQLSLAQNDYDVQRLRVLRRQADVLHAQQQQQQQVGASVAEQQLRLAEFALQREQAREAALRDMCDTAAAEALARSTFALEQASMATWASANVFFAQLHTTLSDCATATQKVAAALADVKNTQRVSRQITREKRGSAREAAGKAHSIQQQQQEEQQQCEDERAREASEQQQSHSAAAPSTAAAAGVDINDLFA